MHNPRGNFGNEWMEGLISAIGGFNRQNTTRIVEYYNKETDEWREADDMNISCSG